MAINNLLAEFNVPAYTEQDYVRERAELLQQFLLKYNILDKQIDASIADGTLSDGDELVVRWLDLQEAEQYLDLTPPKPKIVTGKRRQREDEAGRESGPFHFRLPVLSLTRYLSMRWIWMRSRGRSLMTAFRVF
jgi:hypothetical protein